LGFRSLEYGLAWPGGSYQMGADADQALALRLELVGAQV
jgi:hypothetical protein